MESSCSSQMTERLIQKVRKRKFLYDQSCPTYRDIDMRTAAWNEIGQELNVSAEMAKLAWDKLRRCFANALNRRRQSTSRARKTWRYHKQMAFLERHVDHKKQPGASVEDFLEIDIKEDGEPGAVEEGKTEDSSEAENTHLFTLVDPESLMIKQEPIDEMEEVLTSFIHNQGVPGQAQELIPEQRSLEAAEDPSTHPVKRPKQRSYEYVEADDGPVNVRYPYRNAEITSTQRNQSQTFSPWDMDETDMFFLSMSRMTKKLTLLQQARIKSRLSHEVLEAVIQKEERDSAADNSYSKRLFTPVLTKLKKAKVIHLPPVKVSESSGNQLLKPAE